MKVLLIAALFVFAAQASLLDTTSYTLGFTKQLGLNYIAVDSGLKCFQSVNTTLATLVNLVQELRQDPESALLNGINLITVVNGELKVKCQEYLDDVIGLIVQETTNTNDIEPEEIQEVVNQNSKFYLPQLVQQAVIYLDALIAQDTYKAGTTEAYILQILLGLKKPVQIREPVFNFTQYVPIDTQKYIAEFTQAYASKLNANPETSESYVQCFNSIQTAQPAIEELVRNLEQADSIVEKIVTVQNSSDDLLEVVETCIPALEYNLEILAPVWEQVQENPVQAILTIAHNIAYNAPEIEQKQADETFEIFTGEYVEAGEEAASVFLTAFAGVGY